MVRRFDARREGRPAPAPSRVVTSLANPLVKDIRALGQRKTREAAGLFLAEGLKLVADAVAQDWALRVLVHRTGESHPLLQGAVAAAHRAGGEVLEVTPDVLESLSRRDNPQTVLGVFRQRLDALDAVEPGPDSLWVGLDRVRDPGNLGTILRTADAAGAAGVILIGDATDPFGIEAVRASMGSIFNVRLATADEAGFLAWRRRYAGLVVGTHLKGTADYRTGPYPRPCLLLMGNEQAGLPDSLAAACDRLVKIPMRAGADSLNLAVATGVMLFEMARDSLALPAPEPLSRVGEGQG